MSLQLGQTTQSQALGLGGQRRMATQSGEGHCLCEVRGEAGLHSLKLLLMSLLIVSSGLFV